MYRLKIFKDIFCKPLWGILGIVWGIVGFVLNVFSLFGIEIIVAREAVMNSPFANIISILINNWWFITITLISLAIADGMYKKARPYLGDRINANKITWMPKEDKYKDDGEDKYAWLQIDNAEEFDLRECYAALRTLKIKSGNVWVPLNAIANENISLLTFPEFQDREVIVRSGIPVRLNIAKTPNGNTILFLFKRGDKSVPHEGQGIYIEVVLGGYDYGRNGEKRKIEDKIFKGFLVPEVGVNPPAEMKITNTKDNKKVTTTVLTEESQWYRLRLVQGELKEE